MNAAPRPPDIAALTSIRGVAAWWVVLYHVRSMIAPHVPPAVTALLSKGYLAVDMFFVLSGFVIYLNYVDRLRPGDRAAIKDFFVRRFARIYPLHLLMWLATGAFALAVLLRTGVPGGQYPVREFVLGLFLLQNWGFADSQTWNVPAWSISAEFAAYILFPFIALGLRVRDWHWAALAAGVAVLIGALHLAFEWRGFTRLGSDISGMGLWRCLAQFTMGALLCELYRRRHERAGLGVVLLAIAAAIASGVVGYGLVETLWLPLLWATLILGIALLPERWPNPLKWKPFVRIGDLSYGTYLAHYLVFTLFKLLFVKVQDDVSVGLIALFIALVAAVSWVLYEWFERPAQRFVMRRWKARLA